MNQKRHNRKQEKIAPSACAIIPPAPPDSVSSQPASDADVMTVSIEDAATFCDVSVRTIFNWIADRKVMSPAPGKVNLKSCFDWYRLTRSVLDDVAKSAYTRKIDAETRRIEMDSDYKSQLILDAQHRRLADITSDERKAAALHGKLLLAGAEYLRDVLAQFLLDSVRHRDDPYQVIEALTDLSVMHATSLVNKVTQYILGPEGIDYSKGELYSSVTGNQSVDNADLSIPHWVPSSTVHGETKQGYWGKWVAYTQAEIDAQLADHHSAKGGYFVVLDMPAPTASIVLTMHRLAQLIEQNTKGAS